jgi:hypothetical protein
MCISCTSFVEIDKILHSFSFFFGNLSEKDIVLKSHKRNKKECKYVTKFYVLIELSVKSSKESTKPVSLLKTGNKVVEVG